MKAIHILEGGGKMLYLQDAPEKPRNTQFETLESFQRAEELYREALKVAIEKGVEVAEEDTVTILHEMWKAHSESAFYGKMLDDFNRSLYKFKPGTYPIVGVEVEVVRQWKTMSGKDAWTDFGKGWSINNAHICRQIARVKPVKEEKKKMTLAELTEDALANLHRGHFQRTEDSRSALYDECEETVKDEKCTKCKGGGEVCPDKEQMEYPVLCDMCNGTGKKLSEPEPQDRKEETKEKTIGEMSEKERIDLFEKTFSPHIRYGYNTALLDTQHWLLEQNVTIDFGELFCNKISELLNGKKTVDWKRLKIEIEVVAPDSGESETYPKEFILWYSGMDKVKVEKAFERWKREVRI